MEKDDIFFTLEERRTYFKRIMLKEFEIQSSVTLTQEEIKEICKSAYKSIKQSDHNADSVAKNIVKALPEKLKSAKVTSKDGKKWLIAVE